MTRMSCTLLGLVFLTGLAPDASSGEGPNNSSSGESLYFAHQGKWFEALVQLEVEARQGTGPVEQTHDAFWNPSVDAEFSREGLELSYRMHRRAVRAIQVKLEEAADEPSRNYAAYRLAQMHFRKGQVHDALRALDRISGKVAADIRDDVTFLRANIYLALEWSEPATEVLEKLLGSKEYRVFAAYNLGIAYLQGDLQNEAYGQLKRAGNIKVRNATEAAIRDKANLVLGTLLFEERQHRRALKHLNQVRLDGPFSNRALLSAGWANLSAGNPDRAIVAWGTLAERDPTDPATQEAMLALPYAYAESGNHNQAVVFYGRALDAYNDQLGTLNRSIDSIQKGIFLAMLTRNEIHEDEDWVIRLRALPEAPETIYMAGLLASNNFRTGLQNYLDLADLQRKASDRLASVRAYRGLIAARETHYESEFPEVDEQFRELQSRLQERLEQYETLLQQRRTILESPAKNMDHQARLVELDHDLQSLAITVDTAQANYDRLRRTREAVTEGYTGYDESLRELFERIRASAGQIENLMARQGQFLETLAINELTVQRHRLEDYAEKAQFGLASSFDRANQVNLQ